MDARAQTGVRAVFVTGATGTLGRRVVRGLVAAGTEVRALARSVENERTLRALAATAVRCERLDGATLAAATRGCDAILHLATRIPPARRAGRRAAWRTNDELRRTGTRLLVEAAVANRVRTLVYPGVCFLYPDRGDDWVDASTEPECPELLASSLAAEAEVARFARAGGRGIALRMGYFYGTDAPNTVEALAVARRGVAPVLGAPTGFLPQIWVDDAASAVLAALERAPSGTFDVVEDDPLRRGELAERIAHAVGRRRLFAPPRWLQRLLLGRAGEFLMRSQRVSNRRFRQATGWAPSVPSAREGWLRIGRELAATRAGGT